MLKITALFQGHIIAYLQIPVSILTNTNKKMWTNYFVYVSEASPNDVNYLLRFLYIFLKLGEFPRQKSKVDVHPICP